MKKVLEVNHMLSNFRFNRCYGAFMGCHSSFYLEQMGYKFHHSALAPGYCKKARPDTWGCMRWPVYQYDGRFGSGVVQIIHNPESTQYVIVMYYIRG